MADVRSDGETLAWLALDMVTINHAAPGELWVSPDATTKAELKPRPVRSIPSAQITMGYKAIGGGHYAFVEQHDDQTILVLHVYRLSDGRHWQVTTPSGLLPSSIVWVDADEVLYGATLPSGASHTLIRQSLSQLGPGDAP